MCSIFGIHSILKSCRETSSFFCLLFGLMPTSQLWRVSTNYSASRCAMDISQLELGRPATRKLLFEADICMYNLVCQHKQPIRRILVALLLLICLQPYFAQQIFLNSCCHHVPHPVLITEYCQNNVVVVLINPLPLLAIDELLSDSYL